MRVLHPGPRPEAREEARTSQAHAGLGRDGRAARQAAAGGGELPGTVRLASTVRGPSRESLGGHSASLGQRLSGPSVGRCGRAQVATDATRRPGQWAAAALKGAPQHTQVQVPSADGRWPARVFLWLFPKVDLRTLKQALQDGLCGQHRPLWAAPAGEEPSPRLMRRPRSDPTRSLAILPFVSGRTGRHGLTGLAGRWVVSAPSLGLAVFSSI